VQPLIWLPGTLWSAAMAGLVQNLADVGCVYVERARNRVPWIDRSIQAVEPYILQMSEAVEVYLESKSSETEMHIDKAQQIQFCRLPRVPAMVDLLQLKHSQDQGLLHRARRTGTRLLSRMEAFVDHLGDPDKGGDDCVGLRSLGRCPSESSCSLISSDEDVSDAASELCLTTGEMIPRAIMLPVVLQVHLARVMVGKASDLVSMTTAMGCNLVQSGVCYCVRRTLQGACRVAAHIYVCRRAASLVDGLLGNVPCVRQVMILALADEDQSIKDISHDADALKMR